MSNNSLNLPYIILSATVLIGVILAITVYQPMASDAIELRRQIDAKTATLEEKQQKLRNIQSKVSTLNSHAEHENRLNVVLPQDDSTEDALRVLHIAAQESGVTIGSIKDQSPGVQSRVSEQRVRGENVGIPQNVVPLAFDVNFSGTYRQLRVFLEKIEQSPRIMDVTGIDMSKGEGDQLTANMSIQFYKYNLEDINPNTNI